MDALREVVLESKSLGFDGMGCIHPRQIATIHGAFAPTREHAQLMSLPRQAGDQLLPDEAGAPQQAESVLFHTSLT